MLVLKSVLLLCLLALGTAKFAEELLVTLPNGSPVHGHYKTSHSGHGIRSFTNIPYAEPPVGKLRFADPVPKSPWTGELGNSKEMIICPQEEVFFFNGKFMGQEDCLYLNVYVPLNSKSKELLPVMFYIHGGGFITGSGNEELYGPNFLLDEDVILVAGNYRLGALGFLSTFTEEFPGNFGMKDQVLMMKWIQENIQVFGGDPKKVTIFGESAGAASVSYHLLSPMSKGLFQQGIMHSGTAFETWANYGQSQSLKYAEKSLNLMGCEFSKGNYKTALDCMREKDVKDLVMATKNFKVLGDHPIVIFTPVNEINSKNAFLTEKNYLDVEAGSDVPVMIGMVAQEAAFMAATFTANPDHGAEFEKNFDELILPILFLTGRFDEETAKQKVQMLKQEYFNGAEFNFKLHKNELVKMMSHIYFLPGLSRVIRNRVETGNSANTFSYLFNYRGASSFTDIFLRNSEVDENFGVSHIDDLFYLFPMTKKIMDFRVMTAEDHQVRKQMVKMWTNFAKFGNPSTKKVEWTPAKSFPIDYLRIGNCNLEVCDPERKTMSAMETGLFDKNIKFTGEFFNSQRIGSKKEEL